MLLAIRFIGRVFLAQTGLNPFENAIVNDPTGKSAKTCPAPLAKIFCFSESANRSISASVPSHSEGRFAIVTDAGRDAVDADAPLTNGM
jgi:hypothetical protein